MIANGDTATATVVRSAVLPVRPGYILDAVSGEARPIEPTDEVPATAVLSPAADPDVRPPPRRPNHVQRAEIIDQPEFAVGGPRPPSEMVSTLSKPAVESMDLGPAERKVWIALAGAESVALPPVCVKTGELTDRTIAFEVGKAPGWSYLALLLGLIPGLLIVSLARYTRPHARLKLPAAKGVVAEHRMFGAIGALGLLLGLAIGIVGVINEDVTTGALGLVLLATGIGFAAKSNRLGVKARVEDGFIELSDVHPNFVRAVDDWEVDEPTHENTSGRGKDAVVPPQIRRWNWGAFLLNWIWAVSHSVWIGLLALVPFVGLVVVFVLGAKGNELAWRKKRWDSVESFLATQRRWSRAGAMVMIVGLLLSLTVAIVAPELIKSLAPDVTTSEQLARYAARETGVRAGAELGFSAVFPDTPKQTSRTYEEGGLTVNEVTLAREVGGGAFVVQFADLPSGIVKHPRPFLENVAYGLVQDLPGGNVLQFKQTTVDGDPAAGVLAAREGGYYIRARLVLHGRRFYLLQVMSSSPSPPGFGRFVNSFEILPSPTGPTSQGVST